MKDITKTKAPEGATGEGTVGDPFYDVEVQLTGNDGNAFAILGSVARELRRSGVPSIEIERFNEEAMSGDYDNLLQTAMRWVVVL